MNRERGEEHSSQPAREFFRWTDEMDRHLIDAMIEEARLGNRVDRTWTSQAYTNIVQSLRNAGVGDVSKNHVKNRLKTLKEKCLKIVEVDGVWQYANGGNNEIDGQDQEHQPNETEPVMQADDSQFVSQPSHPIHPYDPNMLQQIYISVQ